MDISVCSELFAAGRLNDQKGHTQEQKRAKCFIRLIHYFYS